VNDPQKMTFQVFDTFAEAEQSEREEWMRMSHEERMILSEELRRQSYPDKISLHTDSRKC
jgi:hypothetical protein